MIYILVTALIVAVVTLAAVAAAVYFPPILESIWSSLFGNGQSVTMNSSMYTAVPTQVFVSTATFVALFILAGTLFKSAELMGGGAKVATALGGTRLLAGSSDPKARRLRNVVEEMAIASGVPVPDIYVLEKEGGINAFAAGFSPSDATVTVTRGAIDLLDRDELQGVIAHEFSHILNGDMRLNIRLIGLLFGITAIHSVGRVIMIGGGMIAKGAGLGGLGVGWTADKTGASDSKILGFFVLIALAFMAFILSIGVSILVFGAGLSLLGLLGLISARAIKSAISRQREYLADASVIQFTRQTKGIAGALKKMGGNKLRSYITAADPEDVSHMLFGKGSEKFGTHPPLTDRIKALDPSFTAADYSRADTTRERQVVNDDGLPAQVTAGIASTPARGSTVILPETITESVGQPDQAHIEYARKLRQSIPEDLYTAAHSVRLSYMLTLALILDRSGQHFERQINLVEKRMGAKWSGSAGAYYADLAKIGAEYRLPLLELAFPALKRRPASELVFLADLATSLVEIDGEIDLYEFCFYRILLLNIGHAIHPSGDSTRRRGSRLEVAQAAVNVVAIVAQNGHEDLAQAQAAFDAGAARLGKWAANVRIDLTQELSADVLDKSLDLLLQVDGKGRRKLLLAICEAAAQDGRLNAAEGELIRVICATLDCPLPPILVEDS